MQDNSLLIYIVGAFLLLNLAIGFFAGRKVKDFRDYALGNKKWSTGAIAMTYLATCIGGGFVFKDVEILLKSGIYISLAYVGLSLSHIFCAFFMAKRFAKYKGCLTLGDILEVGYGRNAKILSGVLNIFFSTLVTGLQIICFGDLFNVFGGFDGNTTILLCGTLIILYTAYGGMRSVTATDIFQFIVMAITLSIIATCFLRSIGGIKNLGPAFDASTSVSNNSFKHWSSILLYFPLFTDLISTPKTMRILMSDSPSKTKNVLIYTGLGNLAFLFVIILIALSIKTLYPTLVASESVAMAYSSVLPELVRPIALIGFITILLSTADSFLHAASVVFVNDIYSTTSKLLDENRKLTLARIAVIFVGVFSMIVAIYGKSIFSVSSLVITGCFGNILAPQLLILLIGFKPNKNLYWIYTCFTIISYCVFNFTTIGIFSDLAPAISAFINFILLFAFSKKANESTEKLDFKNVIENKFNKLKLSLFGLNSENLNFRNSYELFGAFYLVFLLIPYLFNYETSYEFTFEIDVIRFIGVFLCASLLTITIWPKILHKYINIFWQFTLGYCLVFYPLINFLLSGGAIEYTLTIAICIMLLIILLEWYVVIFMYGIGLVASLFTYSIICGQFFNFGSLDFQVKYLFAYQIVLATIVGILFARRKDIKIKNLNFNTLMLKSFQTSAVRRNQESLAKLSEIEYSYKHEALDPIEEIEKLEEAFANKDFKTVEKEIRILKDHLYVNSIEVKPYYILNAQPISLQKFAEDCEKLIRSMGVVNVSIEASQVDKNLTLDLLPMLKVVWNVVSDFLELKQIKNDEDIYLCINFSFAKIKYFSPSDSKYMREIEAIAITIAQDGDLEDSMIKSEYANELIDPKKVPYVDLDEEDYVDSQNIIDAHYGILKNLSQGNVFAWQAVIPINIYNIRPETLDLRESKDSNYIWQEALELENRFLQLIETKHHEITMEYVLKALEMIKKYHSHQIRKSGEPYYMHPINVAIIALDILNDKNSNVYNRLNSNKQNIVLAALLHDILEDTSIHPVAIGNIFGKEVLEMVKNVTKIDFEERGKLLSNEQAFSALMDQEPEVICIKIADRIHNLQTIDGHPKVEKRIAVAEETLMFFTRAAKKYEMQDLVNNLTFMCDYIIRNGKIGGFIL